MYEEIKKLVVSLCMNIFGFGRVLNKSQVVESHLSNFALCWNDT